MEAVKVSYGGNGGLCVKITDNKDADYTHYIAEIVSTDATALENNIGQYEKGESFIIGREALLEAGKSYYVRVKTLKEEYKNTDGEYKNHYYYGSEVVESNVFTLPEAVMPKLKNVTVNFDTSAEDINTNVKNVVIDYEFENDVFMYLSVNASKLYAFGENPNFEDKSTYFKKNWRFVLDDLEDGDYVVDFTAFADGEETDSKDHIKGSQITDVENAYLGFTVDTSAPILSFAQKQITRETDGVSVAFGANTVIADENGVYTIEGITEKAATLMLDAKAVSNDTEGVTIEENGSLTIEKKLDDATLYTSHSIKAIDKAGNTSEIMVWVVNGNALSFDRIEMRSNGEKLEADFYGGKEISLKIGEAAKLSVYGIVGDAEFELDNDLIEWNVMYSKNTAELLDGTVTALTPGETAIKAKLVTANVSNDGVEKTGGISDYVVINVENNSKSDLVDKIYEAENLLTTNPSASSTKKAALRAAINTAKEIVADPDAVDSDYTNGVAVLSEAMTEFLRTSDDKETTHRGGGGGSLRYEASVEQTEHGRVELSHTTPYFGSSLTITAIPDEGYVVSDMLINGESVGRLGVYTISSVRSNINVKVIFAEKSEELAFTDVSESDWFYPYVKSAYESGYMLGVTQTEFEPDTYLTRGMFVTILHRIEGTPLQGENTFEDVQNDEYYANAVAWANKNGIVFGMSETKFAPNERITREQMAAILYRYAAYKGMDVSVAEDTNILSYTDFDEISEYAVSAMQYTAGCGLITGKTESTLNPVDNATRAEAATVFVRFAQMIANDK